MSFGIQGMGSYDNGSNEYPSVFSHNSLTKDQQGKVAVILREGKMQGLSPAELKKTIDAVLASTQSAHVSVGRQKAFEGDLAALKSSGRPGRHHTGGGGGNATGTDSPSTPDATNGADVTVGGQSLQNLQKALVALQQHRQFVPSLAQTSKDT